MSDINKYTYSEVYDILMHMSSEDKSKIPKSVIEFLKENKSNNYESVIDYSIPLSKQKISKKTLSLLAVFYLIIFCRTKEEREEIYKILKTKKEF